MIKVLKDLFYNLFATLFFGKISRSYYFGLLAESLVSVILFFSFHGIIKKRYKNKFGEIDIISSRGSCVYFTEVKSRSRTENIEYSLSKNQIKRMLNAANYFLSLNSKYSSYTVKFQVYFVSYFFIKQRAIMQ